MWIITSDRKRIVNTENSILIEQSGKCVYAYMDNDDEIILGAYKNLERCGEVFQKLLSDVFPEQQFTDHDFSLNEESMQSMINACQSYTVNYANNPQVSYFSQNFYYMPVE